jgi:hypothetical protein
VDDMVMFEVGKPFPVPGGIPHREGAHMELWPEGLVVIIQMPGLRREELKAFKKGFKRYSYLESEGDVPIAVWVFDFPGPYGAIDTNFNAKLVQETHPEDLESFLDTEEGMKNSIIFYLLDGEILEAQKMMGLQPEAVKLFHDTIWRQLGRTYEQVDFDMALAKLFRKSTHDLCRMGRQFRR